MIIQDMGLGKYNSSNEKRHVLLVHSFIKTITNFYFWPYVAQENRLKRTFIQISKVHGQH